MLVKDDRVFTESLFFPLSFVAAANKGIAGAEELAPGVYEVRHFGSSHFLRDGYKDHFDLGLSISEYGVCDNYQQILDQCPELHDPKRKFVIVLTKVRREDQSPDGGWRWHKWGPYIGTQVPTCEYLYDEPAIEQVFVYHIYEQE